MSEFDEVDELEASEPSDVRVPIISMKRETDKAWLVEIKPNMGWWLPKSRCGFDDQAMEMIVPSWLYFKKKEEAMIETK